MNPVPVIFAVSCAAGAIALYRVPQMRDSMRRLRRQPAFVTAVVVLGVVAVGLNAAVGAMRLHFKKRPVPLTVRSLSDPAHGIPSRIGAWAQVTEDEAIDREIQDVLGTGQYLFRDYVDTRVWPAEQVERLRDMSKAECEAEIYRLQSLRPDSVIRAAVTYYTGLADTVAHIPERCYVADGFEPSSFRDSPMTCGNLPNGSPRQVTFRVIRFEDQTGRNRVARDVAYLFHVNGAYESDSLAVRRRLQSLFERDGYYAKVELMITHTRGDPGSQDSGPALAAMADFSAGLLPELERCLPDWSARGAGNR